MKNTCKISAILLTIILCVSILGAAFCFTEHSGHSCTGENCVVCAVLEQCDQRIRNIATAVTAVTMLMFFAQRAVTLCRLETLEAGGKTPVALKVKLLN